MLRLRPYVTNALPPSILRYPNGAIETLIETGLCDNASHMLAFILKQKGYETVQWNMITASAAHSALLVSMHDGRKVLVDPFYGFVVVDKKENELKVPNNVF